MGCETCEDICCQMMEMKAVVDEMSNRFKRQEECIDKVCRLLEEYLPNLSSSPKQSTNPLKAISNSIFPDTVQHVNNNYLDRQFNFPSLIPQAPANVSQVTAEIQQSEAVISTTTVTPMQNGVHHPSTPSVNGKSRSRKQHAPKKAADLPMALENGEDKEDCVNSTTGSSGQQCSTSGAESDPDQEINITDDVKMKVESPEEAENHEKLNGQNGDSGLGLYDTVNVDEDAITTTAEQAQPILNGIPTIASNHQTLIRFLSDQAAAQQSLFQSQMPLFGNGTGAAGQDPMLQAMLQQFQPGSSFGPSQLDRISAQNDSLLQFNSQMKDISGLSDFDTVVQYDSPTERRPRRPATSSGRGGGEKGNFNCELCSSQFMWRGTWKRHMDTVHSKTRYRCTKCGFTSSRKDYLYVHIRTGACSKRKPKQTMVAQGVGSVF